jgi:hypothetical protein
LAAGGVGRPAKIDKALPGPSRGTVMYPNDRSPHLNGAYLSAISRLILPLQQLWLSYHYYDNVTHEMISSPRRDMSVDNLVQPAPGAAAFDLSRSADRDE